MALYPDPCMGCGGYLPDTTTVHIGNCLLCTPCVRKAAAIVNKRIQNQQVVVAVESEDITHTRLEP